MSTFCLEIRVRDRRSGAASDHTFLHSPVRIGRDPACELHLADHFVSKEHAIIETHDHGARLVDRGGTNGLRVAGRRLAPHTAIPIGLRLSVSVGPFDLDIVYTPDRDRQAVSGALAEPGPARLERLHASLRHLHTLHAPHVAARQAFEAALADAMHAFHKEGDLPAARRLLAEFPDHAHLIFSESGPPNAGPEPAPSRPRDPGPDLTTNLSAPAPTVGHPPAPLDLPAPPSRSVSCTPTLDPSVPDNRPAQPAPAADGSRLSLRTAPSPPRPAPHLLLPAASSAPGPAPAALALIAQAAQQLLPDQRPPANLDEARRFLDRLVDTLRSFAAGVGALQHLRRQQARDLGLGDLDHLDQANPLLARTGADELLAELLAWPEHTDRTPELLDAFAVLTTHARAHVCAALAATRHLADELAPITVERHAPRSLLPSRARWHSFRERYAACIGDGTAVSGALRARFRAAYVDELNAHGLSVTP